MRLKADGRTQQKHTINDKFAKFNNALYIAEREARSELEERNKLIRTMAQTELKKQEDEYRRQAQDAREKSNRLLEQQAATLEDKATTTSVGTLRDQASKDDIKKLEEFQKREQIRYIEKREIDRQMRLEAAGSKKAKQVRDLERDISERVALGQAQPSQSKEVLFDSRLYNQTSGLDAVCANERYSLLFFLIIFQ